MSHPMPEKKSFDAYVVQSSELANFVTEWFLDLDVSVPIQELCGAFQAPMLIYGKNGRADLLAIGQKSGMAWGLNPDTGRQSI